MLLNAHGIEANGMRFGFSSRRQLQFMELESQLKCKFNQLPWQTAIKTFAEFSFGPQGDPPNLLQLWVGLQSKAQLTRTIAMLPMFIEVREWPNKWQGATTRPATPIWGSGERVSKLPRRWQVQQGVVFFNRVITCCQLMGLQPKHAALQQNSRGKCIEFPHFIIIYHDSFWHSFWI